MMSESPEAKKQLHGLITQRLIDIMQNGEEILNQKTGELERRSASAAFVQAAMKWHAELERNDMPADHPMVTEIERMRKERTPK